MSEIDPRLQGYLNLCQAIGHVIVQWSLIERQITNCVSIAFNQCGGNKIQSELPSSFTKKREFLKKCFNQISGLKTHKNECLDLLHRASNIVETRHDLIHGTITDMSPPNGIFRFDVLKAKGGRHYHKQFDFDPRTFPKLEATLSSLVTDWIALSQKLADEFLRD